MLNNKYLNLLSKVAMATKRQHYIPRLHLRHFAGVAPKGHVWTYDSEAGSVRSSTPENTAVQSHFYSIEGDDGSMDTRVEDLLAKAEGNSTPAYEALLRNEIPRKDTENRANFAYFLSLMYVRTPAMRRMAAEMAGRQLQIMCYAYGSNLEAFDALNRRAEAGGARKLNEEEKERLRQDFLDPSKYTMQISQQSTLQVLETADKLAPILFEMTWSVIEPQKHFFITTDNPLVREVDPKTRHPIYGDRGFMNKTAEVIFPLSPQRLLLMSWNSEAPEAGIIQCDNVKRINRGLAAHSDRYLYSHVRTDGLARLAEKYKNSKPNMTTQGFGPENFAKIEVRRRLEK